MGGIGWHGVAWHGIGLNYTYSKILNDLKVEGRCKDTPLLLSIYLLFDIKQL